MILPNNTFRLPAPIAPVTDTIQGADRILAPAAGARGPGSFQSALSEALGQAVAGVQSSAESAKTAAERFLTGENEEVHHVALETQKAELNFEMFMAVRNKVVQAYQEVMRMQM